MPATAQASVMLVRAKPEDAALIASLRMTAAAELTRRFGNGTWSFAAESEAGVRTELIAANVFVVWSGRELIATLKLGTRNPWLGDIGFFTPTPRPLYLTAMVVVPAWQRRGVGRACLAQARIEAAQLNADMLRLDTYDGPAGAAGFYRRCGFREVRRADYNGTALVWFEAAVRMPVASAQTISPAGSPNSRD